MNGIGTRMRISGLNSGLDTEKIVKDMLAISQLKVDRQYQSRQTLIWKQEAYRTSISSMNSLKSKWFSSANPSNFLGSSAFFASANATTDSKLFSVKANAGAKNGNFTIDSITQLATSHTIKGKDDVAAKLEGIMDADDTKLDAIFNGTYLVGNQVKKGVDFDIVLDGVKKTINLQGGTKKEIADNFQAALDTAFGTGRIQVKTDNPANPTKIGLDVGNSKLMIGSSNQEALAGLGLKNGQSNKIRMNDKLSETAFKDKLIGGKFEFTINDTKFSFTSDNTMTEVLNAVNSSKAGVDMTYDEINNTFSITSKVSGTGKNIRITQEAGNLLTAALGTKVGDGLSSTGSLYTNLTAGAALDRTKLNDAKNQGFDITINGVTKTVYIPGVDEKNNPIDYTALTDEEAMKLIENQINGAFMEGQLVTVTKDADGKMVFGVKDGTTMTFGPNSLLGNTPEGREALRALGFFDDSRLTNVISGEYTYKDIVAGSAFNKNALGGASFDLTINGETKTVTIPTLDKDGNLIDYSTLTDAEAIAKINEGVKAAGFSDDRAGRIGFYADANGNISILVSRDTEITMGASAELGFAAPITNVIDKGGLLSELGIGAGTISLTGKDGTTHNFNITATTSIKELMNEINNAMGDGTASYKDGKFDLRNVTGASGDPIERMFGVISFDSSGSVDDPTMVSTEGKNAIAKVNGTDIERSSNTFVYDGVEVTLKGTTDPNSTDPAGQVTVSANVDDTVEKIKEFIKDYNALIDVLTLQTTTKPNKDYQPLTDEQKKGMTEQQIKDWDKVAKQGVVYNDTELNRVLGDLRTAMYTTSPMGMALYEMGITTGDYQNGGKLEFAGADYSGVTGEDKLRKALTEKPDMVANLFTDPVNGIAAKITNTLDSAASTSATKKGSLVTLAGVEKHSSEKNNTINKSITDIDALIVKYKKQLADEEDRYWAQFNALESAMAKLNNQSSMLMQQLGQ